MWRFPESILVALLVIVASAAHAPAAAREHPRHDEQQREQTARLLRESTLAAGARLTQDGRLGALRGRFEITGPRTDARRDPEAAARGFLSRHAAAFGLHPDLDDLTLARRTDDLGGTVLRFEQRHLGIPVHEASVIVSLDPAGRLIHVTNGHVPGLGLSVTPRVSPAEAVARAEEAAGVTFGRLHEPAALAIAEGGKEYPGHRLAWRIHGTVARPRADWLVFVDASTGEAIRLHDLIRRTGPACVPCVPGDPGCGWIFAHSPVVVFDNPSLTDASNVDAGQTGCLLQNLTSATLLDGLYVTTNITAGRATAPWNWLRSANQHAVDEVNVYYHVDRSKRYLTEIGFPGVMNFAIRVDAHDPTLGDNAHYVPSQDIMEFGTGGVDDAQDPDIVYHEVGHAIQDNQVPNFGQSYESGSMGEGFGDYWAAALTDDAAATALGTACIGEWDATFYDPWNGNPGTGCLRRVDGSRQYPKDLVYNSIHADGEIWSAALWRLRQAAGAAMVDPLVIKSHTFLDTSPGFVDAADALLAADAALYGGTLNGAIETALAAGGIPHSALPASSTGLTQTTPFVCETAHNYANGAYKECGLTIPGATRMRFHFSRLDTELNYDIVRISDPAYREVQTLSGTPFGSGSGKSAAVHGDTIVARFKADTSIVDWGFRIDAVEYATGAGAVPNGAGVPGTPLMVNHAPDGAIALSWGASCGGGDDYAIYEGTLGNYVSHLPVACSTGGLTATTILPPGHSTYYLVVPITAAAEGSYGQRSNGTERPASVSRCRPQQILDSCS